MTTNAPMGMPQVIFESKAIMNSYAKGTITPEEIRSDEQCQEAFQNGDFSSKWLRSLSGLPFYMAATNPSDESSSIAFERHFNPLLKKDSDYFQAVGDLISCVERNASKSLTLDDQNTVCKKEMKNMRLSAF